MKKEFKIIMLPTQKSNNVGDIVMRPSDKRLAIINILTTGDSQETINQHLYVISDDEIKEGDWYYNSQVNIIIQTTKDTIDKVGGLRVFERSCKKIIATTDKSLKIDDRDYNSLGKSNLMPLPQIPESFIKHYIEEYNKGNIITTIELENGDINDLSDRINMENFPSEIIKTNGGPIVARRRFVSNHAHRSSVVVQSVKY